MPELHDHAHAALTSMAYVSMVILLQILASVLIVLFGKALARIQSLPRVPRSNKVHAVFRFPYAELA